MILTFDVNIWSLLGVLIALYSVLAGRAKASADQIESLRTSQASTNTRFGERIQALETWTESTIGHQDLDALRKLNDERLILLHSRVDGLHAMFAEIKGDIGEMKGILRNGLHPSFRGISEPR